MKCLELLCCRGLTATAPELNFCTFKPTFFYHNGGVKYGQAIPYAHVLTNKKAKWTFNKYEPIKFYKGDITHKEQGL
jgi:hypothetical protein